MELFCHLYMDESDRTDQEQFSRIVNNFSVSGDFFNASPCGSGHINDTFLVSMRDSDQAKFLLQKINARVFQRPDLLMQNLERICAHLRSKMIQAKKNPDRHSLTLVSTKEGKNCFVDEAGDIWRLRLYIDNVTAVDRVEVPEQAREAGRAFGEFLRFLVDLPGGPLHEIIPSFHDLGLRLKTFQDVIKVDSLGRCVMAGAEISYVESQAESVLAIVTAPDTLNMPLRTTHNDTKINNVLLDARTGESVCVIDLDTVMPGLVIYDFGDCVRTGTNTGDEDDPDLDRVGVDLELFRTFSEGYASEAATVLTSVEREALVSAGVYMSFIIGLRFLTDYLSGDPYFRTDYPGHNLQRARSQFKMVESFKHKRPELEKILQGSFG